MKLLEHAYDHKIKKSCLKSYFSYNLIVALACVVASFLTLGYAFGSMSILSLYYQEHYGTRELSINIGTVQVAVSLFGGKHFSLYRSAVTTSFLFSTTFVNFRLTYFWLFRHIEICLPTISLSKSGHIATLATVILILAILYI